ncbi:MAG: LPS assembly protein LptD, partial [Pseudomonadota bacterium]
RGDLRKELDTSNTNRLRSNVFARWQDGGSRLQVDSFLFQGLRSTDDASLTPFVLPFIDFQHDLQRKVGGGKLQFNANFASLQRTSGTDSRRITAGAQWRREHFTPGGHRFQAFAELRGDAFFFQDLDEGTELCSSPTAACAVNFPGLTSDETTSIETRFAPTAGLEWSYPLTRRAPGSRIFIEPRVQLVASPADRNQDSIINEDSQSIEFDYVGLFDYNKATGFDRFEDGQRANVGVAASLVMDNGVSLDGSVGGQFRLQSTDAFSAESGLGEQRSDIVGSLNLRYKNRFGIENRFRIDDDSGSIERAESLAYLNFWRFRSNLSYVRLTDDESGSPILREEVTGRANFRLTRHWSAGLGWRENLNAPAGTDSTIRQDFILAYRDECSFLELTYRRDQTTDAGLPPDDRFLVRFTLRSLVD